MAKVFSACVLSIFGLAGLVSLALTAPSSAADSLASKVPAIQAVPAPQAQQAPQAAQTPQTPQTPQTNAYQLANARGTMANGLAAPIPRARPAYTGTALSASGQGGGAAAPLTGPAALVNQAAAYRAFDLAIVDLANRKFQSPRDVRAALDTLRPYDPEELAKGWIANSAFLAAAQPEFEASLEKAAKREGKNAVIAQLNSGSGVWQFDGSQQARSVVVADASAAYERLTLLGDRFITTAYEFQRTRWGSYEPPSASAVHTQFAAAEDIGATSLSGVLAELAGITPAQAAAPVMQRILVLAGHIVLDDAGTVSAASLTQNRELARCARFARLNLNQCLAASNFPSEEAYCTGKHAVNEIASCWATYLPGLN